MGSLAIYGPAIPYWTDVIAKHLGGTVLTPLMASSPTPIDHLVMVGCYYRSVEEAEDGIKFILSAKRCLVVFCGSDLLHVRNLPARERDGLIGVLGERSREIAVDGTAATQREAEDLVQRPVHRLRLPPPQVFPFSPIPVSNDVLLYCSPENRDFYGFSLVMDTAALVPDLRFHLYHILGFPGQLSLPNCICHPKRVWDMEPLYRNSLCALRFTAHDTLPMTCIEAMMVGRPVLTHHKEVPHAFVTEPTPDKVAEALRAIRELARVDPRCCESASRYYHKNHGVGQFRADVFRLLGYDPPAVN